MNIDSLVLDPAEAKERYDEYRALVGVDRSVEDAAILGGYRAAAAGLAVISLETVVAAGGTFPTGLPRIAIPLVQCPTCHRYTTGTSATGMRTCGPCAAANERTATA